MGGRQPRGGRPCHPGECDGQPRNGGRTSLEVCGVDSAKGITDAPATLLSIGDVNVPTGPFTALLASGDCAGVTVSVPAGQGLVTARLEGSEDDAATVPENDADQPRRQAIITIEPDAAAWPTVADGCDLGAVSGEPIEARGYVTAPAGPISGNAPFDAEILCPDTGDLVSVELAADEGSYSIP